MNSYVNKYRVCKLRWRLIANIPMINLDIKIQIEFTIACLWAFRRESHAFTPLTKIHQLSARSSFSKRPFAQVSISD